jgi:imidazolonepropionase-like amidohydrolase
MVDAGLTPYEILVTGTRNVAEYFGALDERGTVEAGKVADLLLLEANPLADVANVGRLSGVMVRGRWLPRAELDRLLESLRRD